jgi:hypothetical protein
MKQKYYIFRKKKNIIRIFEIFMYDVHDIDRNKEARDVEHRKIEEAKESCHALEQRQHNVHITHILPTVITQGMT